MFLSLDKLICHPRDAEHIQAPGTGSRAKYATDIRLLCLCLDYNSGQMCAVLSILYLVSRGAPTVPGDYQNH